MIICACIEIWDYDNPADVLYVCGVRHGDCYTTMTRMNLPPKSKRQETEGFLDQHGNFYDRYEAFNNVRATGQLCATALAYKLEKGETELYSEDLW